MQPYFTCKYGSIYMGDCLRVVPLLNIKFDMVCTDPPYGTTNCKWDSVIPMADMWEVTLNARADTATPIVVMSAQPYTSLLISSNISMFRYELVWEKTSATGFFNAKHRPLSAHENICVFYEKCGVYNPQMTEGHERKTTYKKVSNASDVYNPNTAGCTYDSTSRYPRSVMRFKKDVQTSALHPTQKPVALIEYLVRTYTDHGGIVLDFSAGSGTTAVAAINSGRRFVCVEKEEKYCKIAAKRIEEVLTLHRLAPPQHYKYG